MKKKYKEIDVERLLSAYEVHYRCTLSKEEKKTILNYGIKSGNLSKLKRDQLLLLRNFNTLQIAILDLSGCDAFKISV